MLFWVGDMISTKQRGISVILISSSPYSIGGVDGKVGYAVADGQIEADFGQYPERMAVFRANEETEVALNDGVVLAWHRLVAFEFVLGERFGELFCEHGCAYFLTKVGNGRCFQKQNLERRAEMSRL